MASRARRTRGGGGSGLSGLTSGRPRPRGRPRPLRDPGRRRARSAGLRGPDPREDLSHPYPESPSQAASRASPRIPRPSGWPGSPASGPSRDPLPRSTSDSSLEGTPTDPPPESTRSPQSPPAVRKACRETTPDISTSAPDPVLRLKNLPQRTLLWPQIPHPPPQSRNIPPGPLLVFQQYVSDIFSRSFPHKP